MIVPFFRQLSIRQKLVALFMFISATALMIASLSFVIWDYVQYRGEMRRELSIQTRIVLENSTAAMSFQDHDAARETMETLAPNTHIQLACLYDSSGVLFAEYRPGMDAAPCPHATPPDGSAFAGSRLEITESTKVGGQPAGSIYIRSDVTALVDRLEMVGATGAIVLVVVLVIAFTLSASLQRIISIPIAGLARTAREVSDKGDYSLRATRTTTDELGVLVDAFNGMLEQMQRAQDERIELLQSEREANRLKDEFLMTLSHELRTPLNAILGWTRMLTAKVIPAEAAQRALEKIERNAQAQVRLVEDLLEVSRFTTGKFRLQKQPVELVSVVNNAIEAIRPEADAREIAIDRRFPSSPLGTFGDPDRLQQVAMNLLSNAVKFSQAGSRIMVTLRRQNGADELIVSDAGVGIDPDFLPSVFEPFRQADASTTRMHGGLGLGLSIVRRITEMHGGQVSAASQGEQLGATFTVRLPVTVAGERFEIQEDAPGTPAAARNGLGGLSVLVVDDDTDSRELLESFLGAWGASVQAAGSVAEALQLAGDQAPDALISDLAMPREDGYALIHRLQDLLGPAMPRVRIALTAQAGEAHKRRALAAGFQRYVIKPFDPLALVELLKELARPGE